MLDEGVEPGPDGVPDASEQPVGVYGDCAEHSPPEIPLKTLNEALELLDWQLRDTDIVHVEHDEPALDVARHHHVVDDPLEVEACNVFELGNRFVLRNEFFDVEDDHRLVALLSPAADVAGARLQELLELLALKLAFFVEVLFIRMNGLVCQLVVPADALEVAVCHARFSQVRLGQWF